MDLLIPNPSCKWNVKDVAFVFLCTVYNTQLRIFHSDTSGHQPYGDPPAGQATVTPTRCPASQLGSDTIYLQTASDGTGQGLSLQDAPRRQSRSHLCSRPSGCTSRPLRLLFACWSAGRTQENILLTGAPVYYKGHYSGSSRRKTRPGQGMWEGAQSLPALPHPPHPQHLQPRSSLSPSVWSFMETPSCRRDR